MRLKNKDKKIILPGIGMRIVKSAIAVFLCYLINPVRNGAGIVFYSQLAALWCMQDYVKDTKDKARQRAVGTLIGALWGLLFILFRTLFNIDYENEMLYGFFVAIAIIGVIYSTVVLNKKQASYFSCVVFLSIVVNHVRDANPYIFLINRVLDTMIGIVIGVTVNCFRLPHKKNEDILFLSGIDDTLLAPNGQMSPYSIVELNRLIEDGASFSISTIRTPASLMEPLKDIKLKLPVIVMDGAALYNIAEKRYEYSYVISGEKSKLVMDYLNQNEIPYFANVIVDDVLLIYYQKTSHWGYNKLIEIMRKSPYRNYINRKVPDTEKVVYFLIIDTDEKINALYDILINEECMNDYKLVIECCRDITGYSLLKIYNHNASKDNMIEYLKHLIDIDKVVTFGTIEGKYDHVIDKGDFNRVVKLIKKEYEF